jgi:hypothetical protein
MIIYKSYFSIDGSLKKEDVFEGYTDGSTWRGWANVLFTREQAKIWAKTSPYDYLFSSIDDTLVIYIDKEGTQEIQMLELELGDGKVPCWDMNGYCFVELERTTDGFKRKE